MEAGFEADFESEGREAVSEGAGESIDAVEAGESSCFDRRRVLGIRFD
jgi:hypothetical protein